MSWLRLLCVALSLLSVSAVHAKGGRQLEALLRRATWLEEHGHHARAVSELRRAMISAPENPAPVARFAALALPGVNDPRAREPNPEVQADAETVLRAIEEVAARDDTGVGQRADSLYAERIWALALARSQAVAIELWLGRDVRISREHAAIGRQLAALAIHRDDLPTARSVLAACVRVDAEDQSLRSDLAAVELADGNAAAAVVLFRDVAMAHPDDVDAQRDLAGALLAAGDAWSAMELLRTTRACIQLCDCALELTRAAFTARQPNVAVEAAGWSLRGCPMTDPEPALWLGAAEQLAGHTPQASTAFRLALRRDPQSPRALEGLRTLSPN